jgi:hypothetical protein
MTDSEESAVAGPAGLPARLPRCRCARARTKKTPDLPTQPPYTWMASCQGPEQHPYVTPLAERGSTLLLWQKRGAGRKGERRSSRQEQHRPPSGYGLPFRSARRAHRAVPPLRRICQALGEQLLEFGARAAPQQQGHAPVALGLSAAGIGAARWARGGPAPASPGSGWFDTGHERDGERVPASALIRRLLAGSRLGARPLGNSSARAWHRPPLPGADHELTELQSSIS